MFSGLYLQSTMTTITQLCRTIQSAASYRFIPARQGPITSCHSSLLVRAIATMWTFQIFVSADCVRLFRSQLTQPHPLALDIITLHLALLQRVAIR